MATFFRIAIVGIVCAGMASAAVYFLTDPRLTTERRGGSFRARTTSRSVGGEVASAASPGTSIPLFSVGGFEDAGYPTACLYTGPIADRGSIEQVRDALEGRSRSGIAAQLETLRAMPRNAPDTPYKTIRAQTSLAYLNMYDGRFHEAAAWAEKALATANGQPAELQANLEALIGVIHLRRGETENCVECVGPSSCIFPIDRAAVHTQPSGSREAVKRFTSYLRRRPEDLGVRYLLNVAHMTLGEYPDRVPKEFLMPLDPFRSRIDVGRFENVAQAAGLGVRGANMAGGSIFDDFDGDGRPDVFTTSYDTRLGASLFLNQGDGVFADRSKAAGLADQPLVLNCAQADYDNDGKLDLILVRGGWENASRMTLLHNLGNGAFEDATLSAGLGEPIASQSAAWGDYDNDGLVDLFVCGEYAEGVADERFGGSDSLILNDPRNRCRLYHNLGGGNFVDVAAKAGVTNERYTKGATWGDYDGDGFLDLYVTSMGGENRLYHNDGKGSFTDVARELGVGDPTYSFACWFWDFDNDGRLDIYVNENHGSLYDVVSDALGQTPKTPSHPRLYRNLGKEGFRDVSLEMGLNKSVLPMGANFGDIDEDGYLDIYLATGRPAYSVLVPNVLYKNVGGTRFEDVTASSGTGHLQKGHGVSFADYDDDGDVDLFSQLGGAVPGDRSFNALFRNPGHGRHALKVKLVGTKTNRAALGARLRVDLKGPDGASRSIYRQVGGGSSFGGSSLVETFGLGDSDKVASLTVTWPVSGTTQTFRELDADQSIEITEGDYRFHHLKSLPRPARKP